MINWLEVEIVYSVTLYVEENEKVICVNYLKPRKIRVFPKSWKRANARREVLGIHVEEGAQSSIKKCLRIIFISKSRITQF